MECDDRIKELEKQVEQQQKVIEALIAALETKQVVFIPQPVPEPAPVSSPWTSRPRYPNYPIMTYNLNSGDSEFGDVQVFI